MSLLTFQLPPEVSILYLHCLDSTSFLLRIGRPFFQPQHRYFAPKLKPRGGWGYWGCAAG